MIVKASWIIPGEDERGLVPSFAVAKRFVDILPQALAKSDVAAARMVTIWITQVPH